MKKLTVTLALLFVIALSAIAQQTNGTIVYKEITKLDIKLPDNVAAMNLDIPKERKTSRVMYFDKGVSIYKKHKEENSETTNESSEGTVMKIRMQSPEYQIYKDVAEGTKKEQKDVFGKLFLVDDTLPKIEWKLTGQQKKYKEFVCQEATATYQDKDLTAWFTPQIPVSSGPKEYSGLPGMILKLEKDGGKTIIEATNIQLGNYPKAELVAPKKGKVVTEEKFIKIMQAKKEEMKKMYGGGGNVFIKTIDN